MEEKELAKPEPEPENPLSRAIIANEDGTVTQYRCHLCKSKLRPQIEAMYEESKNLQAIKTFCETNNEPYPLWRIRNHFKNHYEKAEMQVSIMEYRDYLSEMMKRRRNMVDDIEHSIAISWIELAKILALPANDMDSQYKKQRIIADLQRTIKENHEFIKSLHDSEAKARATEERFARVWTLKLEEAKTPEEKELIINTMRDFKDKMLQMG